ncbi:MAG: hypothetical protein EP330_04145 [Deltaproteobacteria bacterium]|nr:MAG: hypothetical protein EP330_04145 [Deltaproteobacteria bacterium]
MSALALTLALLATPSLASEADAAPPLAAESQVVEVAPIPVRGLCGASRLGTDLASGVRCPTSREYWGSVGLGAALGVLAWTPTFADHWARAGNVEVGLGVFGGSLGVLAAPALIHGRWTDATGWSAFTGASLGLLAHTVVGYGATFAFASIAGDPIGAVLGGLLLTTVTAPFATAAGARWGSIQNIRRNQAQLEVSLLPTISREHTGLTISGRW